MFCGPCHYHAVSKSSRQLGVNFLQQQHANDFSEVKKTEGRMNSWHTFVYKLHKENEKAYDF